MAKLVDTERKAVEKTLRAFALAKGFKRSEIVVSTEPSPGSTDCMVWVEVLGGKTCDALRLSVKGRGPTPQQAMDRFDRSLTAALNGMRRIIDRIEASPARAGE